MKQNNYDLWNNYSVKNSLYNLNNPNSKYQFTQILWDTHIRKTGEGKYMCVCVLEVEMGLGTLAGELKSQLPQQGGKR